jgi:iron(III) transport system substrate-binding protein
VYDAEAAKTVGLERRLVSERRAPRADVFWNSEYLRTLRLTVEGVFDANPDAFDDSIPTAFRSPTGHWVGFGVRARVFIVNTDLVPEAEFPAALTDLIDPRWKGKVAIAKPYFGTTSTHFAALYTRWGDERFTRFLEALKANEVAILPGNADVRDAVASGRFAFGLTDTDDALGAIRQGKPVELIFPDQNHEGAFGVFHTVGLVRGGPNPENAAKLAAYLSSAPTEEALIASGAVQLPVRTAIAPAKELNGSPTIWQLASDELIPALAESAKLIRTHLE